RRARALARLLMPHPTADAHEARGQRFNPRLQLTGRRRLRPASSSGATQSRRASSDRDSSVARSKASPAYRGARGLQLDLFVRETSGEQRLSYAFFFHLNAPWFTTVRAFSSAIRAFSFKKSPRADFQKRNRDRLVLRSGARSPSRCRGGPKATARRRRRRAQSSCPWQPNSER